LDTATAQVMKAVSLLLVGVALLTVLVTGLWLLAKPEPFSCGDYSVKVEQGDTLYGLAREHCEGNTDEVTGLLVRKHGADIERGQMIDFSTLTGSRIVGR
jgi:hypothetical protein